MFKYLHSYMPETWDELVKKGFINEDSGIRFIQGIRLKEEEKFNDPNIEAEEYRLFVNMLDAITIFINFFMVIFFRDDKPKVAIHGTLANPHFIFF